MKKIIMLRGLSGAGKSSWAKQFVKENPGSIRVNKDDLRRMCHDGHWTRGNEKMICDMRDAMVARSLQSGHTVLVDDTNFASSHEARLRQIATEQHAEFEIKDFVVDFEEALERDAKREHPVGYTVLKQQWNDYVRPTLKVEQDVTLPPAVLFDMDGTLALLGERNAYDASTCEQDELNSAVADLFANYKRLGSKMVIFSGREDKYREQTVNWLEKYNLVPDLLAMRKEGDNRKDCIVKEEMFRKHLLPNYYTMLAVDDRDQVVRMYRDLGLTVFQVADGNF